MNDALHAERPNDNRCPPECGIGLVHALHCPVVHPEMAAAPPLPEGWSVETRESSDPTAYPLLLKTPRLEHAISLEHARALGLALIHGTAVIEERDRG